MTITNARVAIPIEVQRAYRDNFPRHILSTSLYVQSAIMHALAIKHGHHRLRINFEPYIVLTAARGARLSEIAQQLGISRQAANQAANQIEAAGYVRRCADPSDGRAKLLIHTARGKALIKQGVREASTIQAQLQDIVGKRALVRATATLTQLNRGLGLLPHLAHPTHGRDLLMAALLPRLADHITDRLRQLTMAKGHPDLKRSFGQVLTCIGPTGGRMQQMAKAHDVSKQAISAIASELEAIGYIERCPDPADARQVVLQLTGTGKRLLIDSVSSVDELAAEFTDRLGAGKFEQLQDTMAQLYRSLQLEEDIFGHAEISDTREIARQLYRELGEQGAKALGQILITGESISE